MRGAADVEKYRVEQAFSLQQGRCVSNVHRWPQLIADRKPTRIRSRDMPSTHTAAVRRIAAWRACEQVSGILERINLVEPRRFDQAHDRRRALTRSKRSVNALLSIRPWLGTLLDS